MKEDEIMLVLIPLFLVLLVGYFWNKKLLVKIITTFGIGVCVILFSPFMFIWIIISFFHDVLTDKTQ